MLCYWESAISPFNGFLVSQLNLNNAEDAGGAEDADDVYPKLYMLAPQSVLFERQRSSRQTDQ